MQFRVSWAIDIDADSAEAAAREALRIQRDPDSIATVFTVVATKEGAALSAQSEQIDLTELDEGRCSA